MMSKLFFLIFYKGRNSCSLDAFSRHMTV